MGNNVLYRALVAKFLALAQRGSDPELATTYRRLAFQYERLADWTDGRSGPPTPSEPTQHMTGERPSIRLQ
jgi:hypothetical protein